MRWRTALVLGRVSNLPTVWSNVLTGAALAGALLPAALPPLLVALSLFYVGGMYLNDYCDREIDARERAARPIPAGAVGARTVLWLGAGMVAGGVLLATLTARLYGRPLPALLAGVALAAAIVLYDRRHKGNPAAPWVMGLCRALVYAVAGLAVGGALDGELAAAGALLACHVAGLTYAARREAGNRLESLWPLALLAAPLAGTLGPALAAPATLPLWFALLAWDLLALRRLTAARRDVPGAVTRLIAGIALFDALLIALHAPWPWALAALACLPLTRLAQRVIPGT